ncbi:MAG: ABC transporter ATP-binding protein [Halanaerobiales bacterium]|nr:ABC transporter ATP-binding protein [Halanaerobiales bacterium]
MSKLLEMKNITKRFPGVLANDNIDFSLEKGNVHSLLGENGAGKSTLMSVLSGLYKQDEGEIYIKGEKTNFNSPNDAIKNGIGMVYQHFMLIPRLTVIENIILGIKQDNEPFINEKKAAREIQEIADKYGMDIDPYAKVWQLSVGEQQRVEIIKALYRGAEILILDEPTAVLTPQEIVELFNMVEQLLKEDKAIIFISHKIEEVRNISDKITVLREGKKIGTVDATASKEKLAQMMVGREVVFTVDKDTVSLGKEVLKLENVEAQNNKGLKALDKVSFEIHRGEIYGIAGVDGNGQSELIEVIAGLRKADNGSVKFLNEDITNKDPRTILRKGVAHIPEDRQVCGLVMDMDIKENMVMQDYHEAPHCNGSFMDWNYITKHTNDLIDQYNIKAPSEKSEARNLSGGNQQKLILARELHREPELLLAMHPTRGLDVGAIEYVHEKLLEARKEGRAILFVSTELDEIMNISDRMAVIYEGKIMGEVKPEEVTKEEVGLMMAGTKKEELK